MKKSNRKGQLTVFIIIGLLILISIATIIYFTQVRTTAPLQRVVAVPEDIQPVYDHVAQCLDDISKRGLERLGTQGGYINMPPYIANNPNAHIKNDALGISQTALWYYEGEDRTPTLAFMQKELQDYIKSELPTCVNFLAFAERYEIQVASPLTSIVTFTNNQVIAEARWLLNIRVGEKIIQHDEYVAQHNLAFAPIVRLATETMKYENENEWFEDLTIQLLTSNSNIPFDGLEFFCGTKKWHVREVKKEIQTTLASSMPLIRIAGTNYPAPLASPSIYRNLKSQAEYIREDLNEGKEPKWPTNVPQDVFEMNRMMLDLGTPSTDLVAGFIYQPHWTTYMDVSPSQGGLMSTAQMKGPKQYLRFLCMNQWHFTYDLIYPVKMMIRDNSAFDGKGYIFNFAFPVIIEDNAESRNVFGVRRFDVPIEGVDFCDRIGTEALDVRATGFVEGGFTAEELADVNITYSCGPQACVLGKTYSDGSGAIRLQTLLPEGCANPGITGTKDGYLSDTKFALTNRVDLQLTRLKPMNITVQIVPYYEVVDAQNPMKSTQQRWLDEQTTSRFTQSMKATVAISSTNKNFDQYLMYPLSKDEKDAGLGGNINLIYDTAQYDIDVILFQGDTPIGGYHAENITITYDDIATANNMILNVVEYRPKPTQPYQEAGMFIFLYERGQKDGQPYWQSLKPTFTP
jgi:hypothetical protein